MAGDAVGIEEWTNGLSVCGEVVGCGEGPSQTKEAAGDREGDDGAPATVTAGLRGAVGLWELSERPSHGGVSGGIGSGTLAEGGRGAVGNASGVPGRFRILTSGSKRCTSKTVWSAGNGASWVRNVAGKQHVLFLTTGRNSCLTVCQVSELWPEIGFQL
ncbi:MAG TPA: hypothetical protein DCR20_10640 [Planctomycetaceae bacterium]|nr:hypothetical protein [Planctomycetaceae bacterium]